MGLDMWLYDKDENEIMYWRKANQIRGWLADRGIINDDDNCVDRLVKLRDLKELVNDCKKILENHSLAESLMPCSSGFFYGGYDYDEYYYLQLQQTVDKLDPIIQSAGEHDHYIYSDWW
jgi:hypothetical protein